MLIKDNHTTNTINIRHSGHSLLKKMDVKILGHIEFMYQSYQVKSGRYVG